MNDFMKSTSSTPLSVLVASLRACGEDYHSGVEVAPVAVLWTDPTCAWKPLIPPLLELMPELLVFGEHEPEQRTGPAIWLKAALAGRIDGVTLPSDRVPVIYLPGIARHELRNADKCCWEWQPLVELLYRGTIWAHRNGRDWTVEAFFVAADGLGLDLSQDESTLLSLRTALDVVAKTPAEALRGRRLEAADFDAIVVGDTPRDLLCWIGNGELVRDEWGDQRWHAFRSRCRDEFGFDPDQQDPLYIAERLGRQETEIWRRLWARFAEAPAMFPGVKEALWRAKPTDLMTFDAEPWPQENEAQEAKLRQELEAFAALPRHEAASKLAALEKLHAHRRAWLWAKLGESELAAALLPLMDLSATTATVPGYACIDEFASWYGESGWKADAACLSCLRSSGDLRNEAALASSVRAFYLPWLEDVATRFQAAMKASVGPPVSIIDAVAGECLLFVDGLRWDLGMELADALERGGLKVQVSKRMAAIPTVTPTAKPAVSPIAGGLRGEILPPEFRPQTEDGKELTPQRFFSLLEQAGVTRIDSAEPAGPAGDSDRGWCEVGQVDALGHKIGADLAREIPRELERVALLVSRLFEKGWKKIRIVTDHGWLLMPGGLEKQELPGFLVESRWARCAVIKGASTPAVPLAGWHWNPLYHVAVAPGARAFKKGVAYAHGGISPQECVIPVITLADPHASTGPDAGPRIAQVVWRGMRCRIEIANPSAGLKVDLRRDGPIPSSSVAAGGRKVEPDGEVSILITDEDLLQKSLTVVLVDAEGRLIAKHDTTAGT